MKERAPSWTASVMAVYRAAESAKPPPQRICYDPIAKHLISPFYRLLLSSRHLSDIILWYTVEKPWPGDLGTILVRTRYIDDYVKASLGKGVQQIVILGAGYDSRAYRIEKLRGGVAVFEVDHPATQRSKIRKLTSHFGQQPDHVVYVPVDFERDDLQERLLQKGFEPSLRTLFIWEGVSMYLQEEAVKETLNFVAHNSGEGSSIIFDYLMYADDYDPEQIAMIRKNQVALAKRGEAWTFGLAKGAIHGFLGEIGFEQVVQASAKDLMGQYVAEGCRKRAVYDFLPLVHATVKPRI